MAQGKQSGCIKDNETGVANTNTHTLAHTRNEQKKNLKYLHN